MSEDQMMAMQAQRQIGAQPTSGKKPGEAFLGIYWPTIVVILFYILVALGDILTGNWIDLAIATVIYLIMAILVQVIYPKHHTTAWILAFLPIIIWVLLFLLVLFLGFVGITAALLS